MENEPQGGLGTSAASRLFRRSTASFFALSCPARIRYPNPMSDKTLSNYDQSITATNVPDLQVVGDGDLFQVITKSWSESEGWMKSTKALEIKGVGCLIQVTTQQRNPDGTNALAEALTFLSGVKLDYTESPPSLKNAGTIR